MNRIQQSNFQLIERLAYCRSNRIAIAGFDVVAANEVLIRNLNTSRGVTRKADDKALLAQHQRRLGRIQKIYDAALHEVLEAAKREALARVGYFFATQQEEANAQLGHEFYGNQYVTVAKFLAEHPVDRPRSVEEATKALWALPKEDGGSGEETDDVKTPFNQFKISDETRSHFLGKRDKAKVQNVSLDQLTATQTSVAPPNVETFLDDPEVSAKTDLGEDADKYDYLPLVVKTANHGLLIVDGHHRLTAEKLRGARNVNVMVIDATIKPRVRRQANATVPVAADLLFDADNFAEDFRAAMRQAGRDSFKVSARGLLGSEVGGRRIAASGLVDDYLIKRENLLVGVPDSIYEHVKEKLEGAVTAGGGERELADAIRGSFDEIYEGRAETVARTETHSVYGAASEAAIADSSFTHKRWLSASDDAVRDSHVELNGEVVPVGEPFSNGLMFPGDPGTPDNPSPPEEVINCRCVVVADEGDGAEVDGD